MPETNRLDELIEWLQGHHARIDLTSAVAAGAGLSLMGVVLLNVSYLRTVNPQHFSDVAKLVAIATIPYLIAGLIVRWLWVKPLRRILPSWLMIACLGSLLIVISAGALSFYMKTVASSAPASTLQTLSDFTRDKVKDGLATFVALTLLTLPITATVYYSGSIVRAVRRWQKGPEPPSILVTHEPTKRGGTSVDRTA
jgi:branched-subunit amino acid ABC-type transport system permease component